MLPLMTEIFMNYLENNLMATGNLKVKQRINGYVDDTNNMEDNDKDS